MGWGLRGIGVLAVLVLAGCSAAADEPAPTGTAPSVSASAAPAPSSPSEPTESTASATSTTAAASDGFDRKAHSIDDPASIWVVVDKKRPLRPKSYVPADLVQPAVPHTNVPQLRRAAARALETMVAAAKRDGVGVTSLSAYRAYTVQKSIFERNLQQLGEAKTLALTAKPGYSEHQTGLADDLGDRSGRCGIATCFSTTPAGKWLLANSWRYGFILRYPKGYAAITGIQWEPWHYRYVGKPLAAEMHRTGVKTLEQFFGLPAAPTY